MVRRMLVRIGELEQCWLAVWPTKERDTGRQIVGGEPRWHRYRGGIDQEGVQAGIPLLLE